jgi:hypothetical protein
MRTHVLPFVAVLALACVPSKPPGLAAAIAPIPVRTEVSCGPTLPLSCDLAWQRAQLWLASHAATKLQTATDVVLATYNTGTSEPRFSFQATREPQALGVASIRLAMTCGSKAIGVRCEPTEPEVQRAFLHYVATGQDVLIGLMRVNDSVRE